MPSYGEGSATGISLASTAMPISAIIASAMAACLETSTAKSSDDLSAPCVRILPSAYIESSTSWWRARRLRSGAYVPSGVSLQTPYPSSSMYVTWRSS